MLSNRARIVPVPAYRLPLPSVKLTGTLFDNIFNPKCYPTRQTSTPGVIQLGKMLSNRVPVRLANLTGTMFGNIEKAGNVIQQGAG